MIKNYNKEEIKLVSGIELVKQVKDVEKFYTNVAQKVNDAFDISEEGIFKGDHDRTSVDQVKLLVV